MNPSKLRVVPSCVLLSLLVLRRTQKPHTAIFIGRCFFLHLRLVARDFLNRHVTPRRKKKLLQPNHPPCRRRATQKKKRCLVHIPPVVVFDRLQRHAFKMLRALGRYLSITLKISLFFLSLYFNQIYIYRGVYPFLPAGELPPYLYVRRHLIRFFFAIWPWLQVKSGWGWNTHKIKGVFFFFFLGMRKIDGKDIEKKNERKRSGWPEECCDKNLFLIPRSVNIVSKS